MGINARKKATIKISIIILVFSLSFNCGLKGISAEVGPHTSSEEILVDKVFTFLAPNDFVFNEHLTEEHLETKDFSTSNAGAILNAQYLAATYR
ncbi:MAG: hypothetical protein KGD67_12215, partial [Candidatus Lokiarchaeota archaeon]|nr:hypothetical protein [Candidatus Lokiarchaeota archaeon]